MRRARDALRIRPQVLELLASPPGRRSEGRWTCPAHLDASSWDLFLQSERCAVHVLRRLERNGCMDQLTERAREVLRRHAAMESMRTLSARHQLLRIGELAVERGWRVVVLKGGLPAVAGREAVDLNDVDVLLARGEADELAAVLDGQGRQHSFSSPLHLRRRTAPGAVPVEIHVSLDTPGLAPLKRVWQEVIPVPGAPGLSQLSPADHLWHVLTHSTGDHPNRRGRLRDLLLLGDAVGGCDDDDLARTERRIAEHEQRQALSAQLGMARGLAGDRLPADRFRKLALARYRLPGLLQPVPRGQAGIVAAWVCALLLGPSARRPLWRGIGQRSLEPSTNRVISWAERRIPRVGRPARVGARTLHRTGTLLLALPIAAAIRYSVRGLGPDAGEDV